MLSNHPSPSRRLPYAADGGGHLVPTFRHSFVGRDAINWLQWNSNAAFVRGFLITAMRVA